MINDRIIFLDKEIDEEVTSNIIKDIYKLNKVSDDIITMWINSPGGIVSGYLAIYDMMNLSRAKISTVCIGNACSCAAMLLSNGHKGLRYATKSSRIMLHQIQVSEFSGSNTEIEIETKELKIEQDYLTKILSENTGQTKAKIKKDTKTDKWFSAEEALKYGIIDHIVV